MIRIIQLLTEKNHFLEKFYSINEAQIKKLEAGFYEEIESFYNKREDLIKIIKYIDSEINKAHTSHRAISGVFTASDKAGIRECMRIKEMFVTKILHQDLSVLSLIDEAKSKIIKELQEVRLGRKAMAGYRSSIA